MIRIGFRAVAVVGITAASVLGGASVAAAATPARAAADAAAPVAAAGSFDVEVFFPTLVTRDVGRHKCEFRVDGQLVFAGTLEGVATGTTTALINAPCADALTEPPGTFGDKFRFDGDYTGLVEGIAVTDGKLSYAGITHPGGSIDAAIKLRADGAVATLRTVCAELGIGGRYRGTVITN